MPQDFSLREIEIIGKVVDEIISGEFEPTTQEWDRLHTALATIFIGKLQVFRSIAQRETLFNKLLQATDEADILKIQKLYKIPNNALLLQKRVLG